jgi:transposase
MAYVSGVDRQQKLLLPESVEEYVGAEHPVRFIDAFVDALDLKECGFVRSEAAATGRPPYAPGDLLKLYLWGYLNRVRSSRALERECGRNLEVLWLMRKLTPDFKTIADFRKDNAKAFKAVFRQFGILCRELGLWGSELVAIDGTRLKAVNSISRNHTRTELEQWLQRLDAKVKDYLEQLDRSDTQEVTSDGDGGASFQEKLEKLKARREDVREMIATLEKTGEKEVSRTDPDSRRMKRVGVGYNGQIAVDDKHHLIVEAEVMNSKNDCNEFLPMAKAVCEAMEIDLSTDTPKPKITADRGYHDRQVLAAAEAAGIESYVPQPLRGHAESQGHYHKSVFTYHAKEDEYVCPNGAALKREGQVIKHGVLTYRYSNASACRKCSLKAKCTRLSYRLIERWEKEAAIERIAERVAANPQIIRRRSALVEHPFGTIKCWRNQAAFLTRSLERVRAEFRLSALAYNLTRVLQIVGVGPLLEKLKAMGKFSSSKMTFKASGANSDGLPDLSHALQRLFLLHRRPIRLSSV